MKIESLCTFSTLRNFSIKYPIDFFEENYDVNEENSHNYYRDLISNGLVIKTDASAQTIETHFKDRFIYTLAVKEGKIKPAMEEFRKLKENENLFFENETKGLKIHLLDEEMYGKVVNKFSAKSGYYFINNNCNKKHLFTTNSRSFSPNESSTWLFAKEYLVPHHSIIIADPYLLKERNTKACIRLFKEIIPVELKGKYFITLVSNNKKAGLSGAAISKSYSAIEKAILLENKNAEVEQYNYENEDFHDRYIITNNTCIVMTYGTDLISEDNKIKKDSTWTIKKPFEKDGYNFMNKKLRTIDSWIVKAAKRKSLNPLFAIKF